MYYASSWLSSSWSFHEKESFFASSSRSVCSSVAYRISFLMLCRNPYHNNQGMLFPCGQCMPCRVNRRRTWTHRIMLEAMLKTDNCFVTLTYGDGQLPICATTYPTLVPFHFTNWLKRLRAEIAPLRIRYYGCGEYGDQTWRPHYHVILFGFPMCHRGRTMRDARTNRSYASKCCDVCRLVQKTWSLGDVDLGEVNEDSAQYIAGYTTKKITNSNDDFVKAVLKGREPEFARMSLKPGIGADFMYEVGSTLLEFDLVEKQGDVPSALRHGGRIFPLGNYLRRQLRITVGMEPNAPESTIREAQASLQPLRDAAFETSQSFKETVIKAADQKVLQMETKSRIRKKRGSI